MKTQILLRVCDFNICLRILYKLFVLQFRHVISSQLKSKQSLAHTIRGGLTGWTDRVDRQGGLTGWISGHTHSGPLTILYLRLKLHLLFVMIFRMPHIN